MMKTVSIGLFLTLYSTVSTTHLDGTRFSPVGRNEVSPNYPQTFVPQSTPVRKPASTVGGFLAGGPSLLALLRTIIRGILSPAQANSVLSSRSARPPLASHLQSQANPRGPLPADRLPPGGAAPISIANGPVPSLQYANPWMGGHQPLHTAVSGKSGAGQPIRHSASHLPGTGGRQPLHIAVNGKSGVGQPIRHPASLLPGTGGSLQADNIAQVPIGVQSGPITTQSQANPNGPLPADRLPPGGAAPISIANGPVPSLQYANPSMGGYQPLHTAVNEKSGAGQPIRHPASHLPGTGGRQPLHIAVNGKSGVGQPIRHPASLLPGTGGSLQADKIPQVHIGVQSGPITTQSQANPNGPLPADRLPPGGATPISIANGPVPSLQYANPSMGRYQALYTAVNGKSGAGQPIRHPASHLPGTGGRQPLHIAVNGKSRVGQPIRHPASLLPGTGGSLQAGNIPQVPIGVQSGPITTQSQANPNGPLPADRLPPGGAAPISIANGPVPSLQYANPSMGGNQPLHTAVNGKSGAGQPIRHPASHLPGTGERQPLHIAVNGKSGVGQPIRHPASLLPGTGGSLQADNIPQVPIGVQSGPITTQSQANPNGPLPADRLPPGGAAPISIANGPVPSLQYANPSMGGYQPLHTAVNGKSGAGQPIRHPASHLPGTGGRQPLHIAVNGKSGVGQPIRHPASLLPGTGGSLQADKIPQVSIGVQSGPITTQSQANPNGPLPADRLPPGGAAPISIANGPVPSLQYANPSMGIYQALYTAVNGKSGAGQPIRHPASHLPGTGGRQPLHIAVNGKSGVGQPIRHPASLLPGTGGSLQAGNIPQVPIGVQSGPITTQSQANPNGPLPADRLPPGGAAPISIANGPVPSLQYANPSMGGNQPLHTAVNGKSGAGQPIRHPASHLPGTGERQPLHIAVNGKSGVGQPIRHPASLLPGTGGSLQAGKITQVPIGVQSGPITTPGQPTRHPASSVSGTGGSIQTGNIPAGSIGVHSGPITTPVQVPLHVLTSTMKTPLSIHLKPPFGEQPFIGLGSLHSGGSLPELPEPAEPNAGEHESVEPAIGKQIPAAILERMRTMHNSPKLKPGVGVPPVSISPSLAPPTYGGPSTRSASTSFVAPTQPSLDALLSQLEGHRPVRKRQKASELPAGATTSPEGLVGGISRAVIDTSTTIVVPLHVRPETSPTVHVSRISNSSEPPAITQSTNSTSRGWSATPNLQRNGPVYTQPSTTTAQSTTRTRTTATVQPSRSTIASIWDLIFGLPTSAPHYPLFDTTQSNYYSISGRSDCDCNRKDDSCPTGKIYAGECHDGIRCCDSW